MDNLFSLVFVLELCLSSTAYSGVGQSIAAADLVLVLFAGGPETAYEKKKFVQQ